MELPSPSYRAYVEFLATVLVTLAVLQYTGILSGSPGTVDLTYLASLAVVLPITTYLLTIILANVEWLPQWDKMVSTDK